MNEFRRVGVGTLPPVQRTWSSASLAAKSCGKGAAPGKDAGVGIATEQKTTLRSGAGAWARGAAQPGTRAERDGGCFTSLRDSPERWGIERPFRPSDREVVISGHREFTAFGRASKIRTSSPRAADNCSIPSVKSLFCEFALLGL